MTPFDFDRVRVDPDFDYRRGENFTVQAELGLASYPKGWVFLAVRADLREGDETISNGAVAHYSPERARALAFTLMDLADLAELQAGTYNPDLDPFEPVIVAQGAAQAPSL